MGLHTCWNFPTLKPLVAVAVVAVAVDDVHVLAVAHLVLVIHNGFDQALDLLVELIARQS